MSELRKDGRTPDQARPLNFERDFTQMALGSVLVSFGRTGSCARLGRRRRPAMASRYRKGLGHGRVLNAARFDARASEPRGGQG